MIKCTRNILLLLLIAIAPISAFAQHDEIDVSVGTLNSTEIFSINDWLLGYDFRPAHAVPNYFASYKRYYHNHISFGFTIGCFFDEGQNKYIEHFFSSSDYVMGTYKRRSIVIAPEASFPYIIRHGFKFYALVGVGLRGSWEEYTYYPTSQYHSTGNEQLFIPLGQITPLAFRFGNKAGGFAEFGWGYKGIINLGLFCKI